MKIVGGGSEDHLIHCFKKGQTCFAEAERLNVFASTIKDGRKDLWTVFEHGFFSSIFIQFYCTEVVFATFAIPRKYNDLTIKLKVMMLLFFLS